MTWTLEKRLIEDLVDKSTGADRRTAVHLRVASIAALRGMLPIGDLDLGDPNIRPPAAKTFLAIFPALALSNPVIDQRLELLMRDPRLIAAVAGSPALDPGPVSAWQRTFLPLFSNVRERYNAGSQSYRQSISNISILQRQKWDEYITELRRYGLTPMTARARADAVIAQLRSQSLDLPSTWDPSDQATFFEAVAENTRRLAAAAFAVQSQETLGAPVPPDLDWAEFCANPAIKNVLRSSLSLQPNVDISCAMDYSEFTRRVYPAFVRQNGPELMRRLLDPPAQFGDGGPLDSLGRVAFTTVIVPPIALFFSLLGALVHIYKVLKYALVVVFARPEAVGVIVFLGVGALALAPFRLPNSITNSAGYQRVEARKRSEEPFGPLLSLGFRWVIQAQPYFYPLNERIRMQVLSGYKFDSFPRLPFEKDEQ
jgi:hypothetical protein